MAQVRCSIPWSDIDSEHRQFLGSPHVVALKAVGRSTNTNDLHTVVFLVIELASYNLKKYLSTHNDLPQTARFDIVIQVARCMHELHQRKLTHCDLKPENILIFEEVCVIAALFLSHNGI